MPSPRPQQLLLQVEVLFYMVSISVCFTEKSISRVMFVAVEIRKKKRWQGVWASQKVMVIAENSIGQMVPANPPVIHKVPAAQPATLLTSLLHHPHLYKSS